MYPAARQGPRERDRDDIPEWGPGEGGNLDLVAIDGRRPRPLRRSPEPERSAAADPLAI
jgi:hypothetical protein